MLLGWKGLDPKRKQRGVMGLKGEKDKPLKEVPSSFDDPFGSERLKRAVLFGRITG